MEKRCYICKETKDSSLFDKNRCKKDGLDTRCRPCRSSIYLDHRNDILAKAKMKYFSDLELFRSRKRISSAKHSKERNEKLRTQRKNKSCELRNYDCLNARNRRINIRNSCFLILGGKCNHCGCGDFDTLCVDHIFDDGKIERSSGVSSITIWRKIIRGEERPRYQLLCFNCNLKKHLFCKPKPTTLSGIYKLCSSCKEIKDAFFFKKYKKSSDGLYYECKSCCRNRDINIKIRALLIIGGCECVVCNINDHFVLTVDHVDNDGSKNRKSDGLGLMLYKKIISNKSNNSRFQVLCLNCNIKKHISFSYSRVATLPQ